MSEPKSEAEEDAEEEFELSIDRSPAEGDVVDDDAVP